MVIISGRYRRGFDENNELENWMHMKYFTINRYVALTWQYLQNLRSWHFQWVMPCCTSISHQNNAFYPQETLNIDQRFHNNGNQRTDVLSPATTQAHWGLRGNGPARQTHWTRPNKHNTNGITLIQATT